MTIAFRPAIRSNTPVIVGIAGPTKSGKTFSALRLAQGLAGGKRVAMVNCEGARGHQYADHFSYDALDLSAPFTPQKYIEAVKAAQELHPGALIIDSMSHMHDGPGGLLEMHDDELDRMAGEDSKKRERVTWTAWIKPKRQENEFIYSLLACDFPTVLCFRAKEKIKIVPGKQPIDLGWQPIASDRVAFETLFSLMLPPHSKGVPDRETSEMRDPFDKMIKWDAQVDETFGRRIAEWAAGGSKINGAPSSPAIATATDAASASDGVPAYISPDQAIQIGDLLRENRIDAEKFCAAAHAKSVPFILAADYQRALDAIEATLENRRRKVTNG